MSPLRFCNCPTRHCGHDFVNTADQPVAYTPTEYSGHYPPYLNITFDGDNAVVTVRGPTKTDGSVGDEVSITVPRRLLQSEGSHHG